MEMLVIGFSKPRAKFAPLAFLIMLCERSNFSHSYARFYSKSLERELIYQATASGVNFVGEAVFDSHSVPVEEYEIVVPASGNTALLQWCVDQAGKPYGKMQLVGLGIVRLARMVGINMANPFSNKDEMYVCCELIASMLREAGLPIPEDLDKIGLVQLRDIVKSSLARKK